MIVQLRTGKKEIIIHAWRKSQSIRRKYKTILFLSHLLCMLHTKGYGMTLSIVSSDLRITRGYILALQKREKRTIGCKNIYVEKIKSTLHVFFLNFFRNEIIKLYFLPKIYGESDECYYSWFCASIDISSKSVLL